MNFTSRWRFPILRESFQLSLHKFAESAVFKTFDDRPRTLYRHEEDAFARNKATGVIDLTEKCGLFDRRAK
jgi:hypothetical protein